MSTIPLVTAVTNDLVALRTHRGLSHREASRLCRVKVATVEEGRPSLALHTVHAMCTAYRFPVLVLLRNSGGALDALHNGPVPDEVGITLPDLRRRVLAHLNRYAAVTTTRELGRELGIDHSGIVRRLAGDCKIRLTELEAFGRVLNVPTNRFFDPEPGETDGPAAESTSSGG